MANIMFSFKLKDETWVWYRHMYGENLVRRVEEYLAGKKDNLPKDAKQLKYVITYDEKEKPRSG